MPGFLDKNAPSPEAEYVRFLEGDVFGKLIFKSYLLRVLNLPENDFIIPIGKWGDMGAEFHGAADALVRVDGRWLDIEIKLARLNIANKTKGQTEPNWAFNNILHSPSKAAKSYNILFAVGINVLGFENPEYWSHFRSAVSALSSETPRLSESVMPHEPEFLSLCGAFVMPYSEIPTNHFRVTRRALSASHFNKYFSELSDTERSRSNWRKAVAAT
jgi:hypothetical protein